MERPDFIARKAIGRGVQPPVIARDTPQPLAVSSGPDGSIAALVERGHEVDQQEPAGDDVAELIIAEHSETARSRQPKLALAVFEGVENRLPPQRIGRRVV